MDKKDVSNELISVAEAAEILGYSRQHVLRLIEAGEINAQKIGRSYAVEKNSLPEIYGEMTADEKKKIDKAVTKVINQYSEALKKLSEE